MLSYAITWLFSFVLLVMPALVVDPPFLVLFLYILILIWGRALFAPVYLVMHGWAIYTIVTMPVPKILLIAYFLSVMIQVVFKIVTFILNLIHDEKEINKSKFNIFISIFIILVLCLAGFSIYSAVIKKSRVHGSAQPTAPAAIESTPQSTSTSKNFKSCKVADVTLSNPDGSKRQDLLKSFYHENGGKGYGAGKLIHDPIDNSSTIYVLLDDEIIGTIPEENISHVLAITNIPCDVSVYVSSIVSENNKPIYFARVDFDY